MINGYYQCREIATFSAWGCGPVSAVMLALTLLILLIPHIWVISGQRVRSAVEQSETSEMGRMIRVIFDSDHSKKLRLSHAIIQWREAGSWGGGGNRKLFFVLRWTRNTAFCWDSRCLNGVTNNLSHVMVSTSLQLTAARWPPLVTFTLVILYFILDSRGPFYGFMPWLQMIFSCSLLSSESFRWKTKQSPLL